jgi:hypothetical protein
MPKLLVTCAISLMFIVGCGPTAETLTLRVSSGPDAMGSFTGGTGGSTPNSGGKGGGVSIAVDAAVPTSVDAPTVVSANDAGAVDAIAPSNVGGKGGSGATGGAGGKGGNFDLPDAAVPPPPAFATWEFEETAQGWADYGSGLDPNTAPKTLPISSKTVVHSGKASLRYLVNGLAGDNRYLALFDEAAVGPLDKYASISFSVWVPSDHKLAYLQGFVLGAGVPWAGVDTIMTPLELGGWKTFTLSVPSGYSTVPAPNAMAIGLHMVLAADWRGFIYLDSVHLKPR